MSVLSTRIFTASAFRQRITAKRISRGLLLLTAVTTVSGCSNATLSDYVSINSQSTIITDPPGARVVVDDKEVGTTPMKFEGENIFEPHWEGTSFMVKSKLEIKKPGCKEYSRIVKDPIPREINVKLDCQAAYLAAPESETLSLSTNRSLAVPVVQSSTIETRLTQAKSLFDKGLIDKTEYRQLKTKILNEI